MEAPIPLARRRQTCKFLASCLGTSVCGLIDLFSQSCLKRRRSAQPLQAQIQAVLPSLTTVLQQQGQNQPQQQPPLPNVNSNTNNIPPVPPSSVPQQSTVATTLAPNNQNASLPKQKNVNQSGNGGSGLGLPVPQNPQGPTNGTNNNPIPSSVLGQAHGTATPTTCRLTGCTNPVYSDVTYNHVSEYCSKRHRK